ncbi:RAMP superfamily CRISPR-associated protein [Corallococcus terminator]
MQPLNLPPPPKDPSPRRRLPGGPRRETFSVDLKTVTPILGGAPVPRQLSEVDLIRVPTLRGHLRFWWRALYGHGYGEAQRLDLAQRERELWGGMSLGKEKPRRSQVDLCVRAVTTSGQDPHDVSEDEASSYALWPSRHTRELPTAPRWKPGLRFTLEVSAPEGALSAEVRHAFRAWVLFGGYGSRTRRGCGTVTLATEEQCKQWLPRSAARAELRRLFGDLPLLQPELAGTPSDLPLLRGACFLRGIRNESWPDGNSAWLEALGWLRAFRQGTTGVQGERPRNPRPTGDKRNRAGRSNWPEADKIRHHARTYPAEHAPRSAYSKSPAWPRAGFGLPIIVHFQQKRRDSDNPYQPPEPKNVQLQWVRDREREPKDRLASPLIVKAMPLANGRFEPIALWLERGYPQGGKVVLVQSNRAIDATRADFDLLRAKDDQPLFNPLCAATSLREAFFTWLRDTKKAREA